MDQLWNDHRGVWTVKVPRDMPLTVIAMLQATITEAWDSYGGVPDSAEQFWNHLVGNGAADVPRETSVEPVIMQGFDEHGQSVEVATSRQEAERLVSTAQHPFDMVQFGSGAYVKACEILRALGRDVPRETERYQVDVVYSVNGGAARSAQRTVDAVSWDDARNQVMEFIESALPRDKVAFHNFSGGVIPDGGSVADGST